MKGGRMLSPEEILATGIPDEVVDVPEWEGKVRVRGLSAKERDAYERSLMIRTAKGDFIAKDDLHNIRAAFVVKCLIDENGERLFTDDQAEALGDKNGAVIDRIWDKARELSGMATGEEAIEAFGVAQDESSSTV